jgi:Xaa-Pro dipeptidase
MKKRGMDAVVAVMPENVFYLTGVRLLMQRLIPERKTYVILTASGKVTLLTAGSDLPPARRDGTADDFIGVDLVDDATRKLGDVLTDMKLTEAKIAIEDNYMSAIDVALLKRAQPKASFISAVEVFQEARLVKFPHEVELLRRAEQLQERAITAAMAMCGEGTSESEMAHRIAANMCLLGAEAVDFVLLQIGVNSTVYHLPPGDYRAAKGDIVHLDCGGQWPNYRTDLSRNVGVTKVDQKKKDTYARLWDVQREVVAFIKPGIRVNQAVAKYMELMDKNKLVAPGPYLGHSVGLSSHEYPEMTPACDIEYQPGMVFAVEPTTFIEGDARYDIEDTATVTQNGCELLSGQFHSRDLWVV